jgi:ABC-type transport system involved in Fe-S cluster assembly fused permease/ATPase subunit
MYYANEFIVNGYLESIIAKSKVKLVDTEISTIPYNPQVSMLHENIPTGNGLTVTFKDVIVKISGRRVLNIKRLEIERGDVIGFKGKGSNLMMPLLLKLINPCTGSISLSEIDLHLIDQENLHNLVSVVPYDVNIDNVSVM